MFARVRVLELASVLAGPSVGQFFAELGAEVIKVENPNTGGDVTRSWKGAGEETDDRSAYFCSCNWGKKSVTLDLGLKNDFEAVRKLAKRSDIVIVSYKPGDAEKLGVDYNSLSKLNPRLIYGQITGYGSDDDRVGYDAVIQAESGFMDINGEKNGVPTKMPVALIDILAAHQLKEGILLALLNRMNTAQGDFVEVSLIQTAISSLANQATNWLATKKLPTRQGSAHPNIAPYGDWFETADRKKILLAVGSDRQFANLCEVLELPEHHNFSTNSKRVEHRDSLNEILSAKIVRWKSADLLREIHALKIPAGPIQNVNEILSTTMAKDLIVGDHPVQGLRTYVGSSQKSESGKYNQSFLPPPHLGEHTQEILRSLS